MRIEGGLTDHCQSGTWLPIACILATPRCPVGNQPGIGAADRTLETEGLACLRGVPLMGGEGIEHVMFRAKR